MRKVIRFISFAIFIFSATYAQAASFVTEARYAVLLDASTDTILFAKGLDNTFQPGNFAKLMSLAVIFDEVTSGRLSLDQPVIISEYAWRTGGAPSRTSTMFAPLGSTLTVRELITGVTVVAANDAIIALAQTIAGTEENFADRMNAYAEKLGLRSSHFVNSTGSLATGQRTSVRDLAHLAHHLAQDYPDLYKMFQVPEIFESKIRQRNRNPLFGMPGVDGLMTNFIADAGYGMATSAIRDGHRLIVITIGLASEEERNESVRSLLDWGFNGFQESELFPAGKVLAMASVYGGAQKTVPLVAKSGVVNVSIPKGQSDGLTAFISYKGPLQAPIAKGIPVGTLRVWRDGLLQREVLVVTDAEVPEGTLWRKAFDATYEFLVAGGQFLIQQLWPKNV